MAEYDSWGRLRLTLWERFLDAYARLRYTPPECEVCHGRMRYYSHGWCCPDVFREDHRIETEGSFETYTTREGTAGGDA